MTKARAIIMKAKDNLATAVEQIPERSEVEVRIGDTFRLVKVKAAIPFGHKFAVRPIRVGEPVIKYGEQIGIATDDIAVGDYAHVHNIESCRGRGDK
jgi:altronate dehydratase small subunit